ncbi:MAG TPA: polyphosphate kinase 1, partial [Candidatus Xenobia bacterium]
METVPQPTRTNPPLLDAEQPPQIPLLETPEGPRFTNRELSWLEFNARVLDEARDPTVPLLERLKFLAIFSSNFDEFFMVRYAGIWRQIDAGVETPGPDGRTPRKVLEAISRRSHELVAMQHHIFDSILPELWASRILILNDTELTTAQRSYLQQYFEQTILPIITPMAIDPGHPFPYLANRTLCLVAELEPIEKWAMPMADTAIIHIPAAVVQRFIRVPAAEGEYAFVPLEAVIRLHVSQLYPGCRVRHCSAIRVTRDGEIDISDDQNDLLLTIEEAVRRRRLGAAVRLQYETSLSPAMLARLTQELELDPLDMFPAQGLLSLTDLMQLWSQVDLPQLKEHPIPPQPVTAFDGAADPFAAIRNGDILLYHPYQDFEYVVRFITMAAADPDVLAIKITLYRMSHNSSIARALLTAARNGKEVAALVELRARFDEEANIAWARRLESTGAHVIYGIAGYKTHCKAALVVRREGDSIRR